MNNYEKLVKVQINGKDGYVFAADYEPNVGETVGMITCMPVIVTVIVDEKEYKGEPTKVILEENRDIFKNVKF